MSMAIPGQGRGAGPGSGAARGEGGRLQDGVAAEQVEHGLGGLGALGDPGLGLVRVDPHGLAGAGDGIHEPEHLEGAAGGNAVVLGHDDVVEGPLLGAVAGETDGKHR
jgi:hypothetical protein